MPQGLPLSILLAPLIIAGTAVATMIMFNGVRGPRRVSQELGYQPDPTDSLSMTVNRYVGGHPELATPAPSPFLLLTTRHLAVFARRWGAKLFVIPWPKVEAVTLLDRPLMDLAVASVRGLSRGAMDEASPDGSFIRVRFEDDRGWWQNVIFEVGPGHGSQQLAEVERFWRQHKSAEEPS